MEGKTLVRSGVMVLCVAVTTLGLNNTYGDNSEVLSLARQTACAEEGCSHTLLSQSRSAFSHAYSVQTRLTANGKTQRADTVEVECKRELIFLGDWRCARK